MHRNFRPFRLQPPDGPAASLWHVTPQLTGLPRKVWASPFTSRLALPSGRIEFTCVADWSFTSCCSPPRLTATQLLSVTGRRTYARRGLAPRYSGTLSDALVPTPPSALRPQSHPPSGKIVAAGYRTPEVSPEKRARRDPNPTAGGEQHAGGELRLIRSTKRAEENPTQVREA
jgi:hypothetical protein